MNRATVAVQGNIVAACRTWREPHPVKFLGP